jgi:hypothetical protein
MTDLKTKNYDKSKDSFNTEREAAIAADKLHTE